MGKEKIVIDTLTEILGSKKVQRFLCGTYEDGDVRSLPDALKDEIRSPKQRHKKKNKKMTYEDYYRKRHKKKKKKKNKGYLE